jgi:hypothetical protein
MLELPKNLKLDYTKWRCGGDGKSKLGEGRVCLLNPDGYMCCLGQFNQQAGKRLEDLEGFDVLPYGVKVKELTDQANHTGLSALAEQAVEINDQPATTARQKAAELQELFLKHGHTIELVNFPEEVIKDSQDV